MGQASLPPSKSALRSLHWWRKRFEVIDFWLDIEFFSDGLFGQHHDDLLVLLHHTRHDLHEIRHTRDFAGSGLGKHHVDFTLTLDILVHHAASVSALSVVGNAVWCFPFLLKASRDFLRFIVEWEHTGGRFALEDYVATLGIMAVGHDYNTHIPSITLSPIYLDVGMEVLRDWK